MKIIFDKRTILYNYIEYKVSLNKTNAILLDHVFVCVLVLRGLAKAFRLSKKKNWETYDKIITNSNK